MICPYNGLLLCNKKGLLIHVTTWMNLKIIMLSERNQTKRKKKKDEFTYIKF